MKKLTFVLFIITLLLPAHVFSQKNLQKKIDEYCNNVDSIIVQDTDIHTAFMVHSINFETNKRVIGKQYTSIKFYYPMPLDSVYESEKGTEFIYIYKPPVKVSVEYNIAASQNNKIDYYFNKNGKLILYKYESKGEYGCSGILKYFNKNKLVRETVLNMPDCNTENKFVMEQKALNEAKIISNAKAYLKMFNELLRTEQLDK
jgi:hypothetical protein